MEVGSPLPHIGPPPLCNGTFVIDGRSVLPCTAHRSSLLTQPRLCRWQFLPARQPGSRFGSPQKNPSYPFAYPATDQWRLDMKVEMSMGLAPADWSVSSAMNDPRPNGRCIFDARFTDSPMGRARKSDGIIWDPRAVVSPLGTTGKRGAQHIDARAFASDMADETQAADKSLGAFGNLSVH